MIIPIVGILLFFLILYIDIETDYKRIIINSINHTRGAIIRMIALIPTVLSLLFPLDSFSITYILFKLIVIITILGSLFLLLFDGFLNLRRGYNWWFLGSIDNNDSFFDKLQRNLPITLNKILKIGIPIIFILIYIIYYIL